MQTFVEAVFHCMIVSLFAVVERNTANVAEAHVVPILSAADWCVERLCCGGDLESASWMVTPQTSVDAVA